ncbi:MAG: hypothetical protein U0Q18_34060 [Bryobacteraceae bacterium]
MKTILLAGMLAAGAFAQLSEPPVLLRVNRQPGVNSASIRPYMDANAAVNVVGMTAITGPTETWLIEAQDSFAGIEDVDRITRPQAASMEGPPADDLLAGARSVIAAYRPALSYRPEQAIQMLQKARYCQISVVRIHPGTEREFAELIKSRGIIFDSVNLDRPDMAYRIVSGTITGTYLFIAPLTTLKVLDDDVKRPPAYAEGLAENAKTASLTRKQLLFRLDPAVSWVSDDFAAPDPEFWHPKGK